MPGLPFTNASLNRVSLTPRLKSLSLRVAHATYHSRKRGVGSQTFYAVAPIASVHTQLSTWASLAARLCDSGVCFVCMYSHTMYHGNTKPGREDDDDDHFWDVRLPGERWILVDGIVHRKRAQQRPTDWQAQTRDTQTMCHETHVDTMQLARSVWEAHSRIS